MNRRLEVFIPSVVFLLSDEEGAGHPCPDWVSSLLLLRWSGLFLSRNLSGILAVCFFLATWQQKLLISRTFCLHSCLLAFFCNTFRVLQDHLLHTGYSAWLLDWPNLSCAICLFLQSDTCYWQYTLDYSILSTLWIVFSTYYNMTYCFIVKSR